MKKNKKVNAIDKNATKDVVMAQEVFKEPAKMYRNDTEKEFQETRLGLNEKYRERFFDQENRILERNFEDNYENGFHTYYNHSFRTFGQKKRSELNMALTQPRKTKYYQDLLETNHVVHL